MAQEGSQGGLFPDGDPFEVPEGLGPGEKRKRPEEDGASGEGNAFLDLCGRCGCVVVVEDDEGKDAQCTLSRDARDFVGALELVPLGMGSVLFIPI